MSLVTYDPTGPLVPGVTLLEASAGTGKTYSIADLYVRFVAEQGVPVDRILVVTYTVAATAELRDRVRRRLGQTLEAFEQARRDPDWRPSDPVFAHLVSVAREHDLTAHTGRLVDALEAFDEAAISTIHGFCQRMLRQNAFESGAEFDVELSPDCGPLIEEIVDDFLAAELHDAHPDWVTYLREHSRIDRADLLALARLIEAEPDIQIVPPVEPVPDAIGRWTDAVDALRAAWSRGADEAVSLLVEGARSKRFVGRYYNSKRPLKESLAFEAWLEQEPGLTSDPPPCVGYFSQSEVHARTAAGEPETTHPVFHAVDALLTLGRSAATAFKRRFALHARTELTRRKQERHQQSYGDLLRTLADGLSVESTRVPLQRAIRERFQVALIDEFQDTDPVQWHIFEQVFADPELPGPAWLYLIGDPKQAIYGFRGADVHTYLRAGRTAGSRRFTLRTNWRSDRRLVHGLNHLLGIEGAFGHREIRYVQVDTPERHHDDRLRFPDGPRAPLQLVTIPREGRPLHHGKLTKGFGETELPRIVARDVVSLLDSGATLALGDGNRPIRAGDVAILVRKSRQARAVQAALTAARVPSVIAGAGTVWESPDADAVQRLLDAVLRPGSEGVARAALACDLLGRTASKLDALDDATWETWVERLRGWQELWTRRGLLPMLRRLLADEAVVPRLLSRPDGERRLTNVLHIGELLHEASQTRHLRPSALVDWLRHQRLEGADDPDGAELRLESDADAVKIVTIHKSKGLQYPVVFCPYLWDGQLMSRAFKEDRHLRFHDPAREHAITLDLTLDKDAPPKSHNLPVAELERQAENLRLLYVALTRAEHRCVLYWGGFAGAESSPLASILHARACDDTEDPRVVARRFARLDDAAILAELEHVAAGAVPPGEPPTIEVVEATPPEDVQWSAPTRESVPPIAREFTRERLDTWWRRGSFSAMIRGSHAVPDGSPEAEGRELSPDPAVEAAVSATAAHEPSTDHPEVPLAGFLRGTEAGTFLHRVLELADFEHPEPSALEPLVREQLQIHGLELDPDQTDRLLDGLSLALRTPLGPALGDLALSDVPRADRLDELAFDLPLAGGLEASLDRAVTARELADTFRTHRPADDLVPEAWLRRLERLPLYPPLRGFLTGSIDLVFRARVGDRVRWYVVDYKSNWLGGPAGGPSTVGHYRIDRLKRAMTEHHYFLQYHLYTVALHRYLGWRLGEAWDYDRDFGGVLYLFLRGMVGPDTPPGGAGSPCGVFHDRPPRALVEALSTLFTDGSAL